MRTSMGHVCRMPVVRCEDLAETLRELEIEHGDTVCSCDMRPQCLLWLLRQFTATVLGRSVQLCSSDRHGCSSFT